MWDRKLRSRLRGKAPAVCWILALSVTCFAGDGEARELRVDPIGSIAAEVEGGSIELLMGGERRLVAVDPFFVQTSFVTYGEFEIYLDDIGATTRPAYWDYYSEDPDRPLVGVNLADILGFLEWLNSKGEGTIYRLPTEAEWRLAYRQGKIEIQPGLGDFLLDYYSETWADWPLDEGEPARNPFGPVLGVHGPEEARNFTGLRVVNRNQIERGPLAPDYTGLGFGFRLAWSLEGPGPLGDRLILQAQLQMARQMEEQPPRPVAPQPPKLSQPVAPTPALPPTLPPTATTSPTATLTSTLIPPTWTSTVTLIPPTATTTPIASATPTATHTPLSTPTATSTPSPIATPLPAAAPPFLAAGGRPDTERFEARGCALEVALPEKVKANEFVRFRLTVKNGFPESKKIFLALSLEVEALAHIEQGADYTFHPSGTVLQSLQRPGANFVDSVTQLPLLQLSDKTTPAGATRVLEVPVRFSQPGKAVLYVRAAFLADASDPRLDLNLPEMGFPDQLGFPCKTYEIDILP